MMRTARLALLLTAAVGACSTPRGPYPSLAPRSAEQIDPRVPVQRPINDRPAAPRLLDRLSVLVAQARAGASAFDSAAAQAERLAAGAAGSGSESWIAAQQALSAAIAAGKPTAQALADIDAIGAEALADQSGIAPNDLAAIQRAADEAATLERRQADRTDAIQRRLAR